MPFTQNEQNWPIVLSNNTQPIGQIVYLQDGIAGSPRGLLLSLTYTSNILGKYIITNQGLRQITI